MKSLRSSIPISAIKEFADIVKSSNGGSYVCFSHYPRITNKIPGRTQRYRKMGFEGTYYIRHSRADIIFVIAAPDIVITVNEICTIG